MFGVCFPILEKQTLLKRETTGPFSSLTDLDLANSLSEAMFEEIHLVALRKTTSYPEIVGPRIPQVYDRRYVYFKSLVRAYIKVGM